MNRQTYAIFAAAAAAMIIPGSLNAAEPIDKAFTYQGKLMDGAQPANGTYDLYFNLYDDPILNDGVATGILRQDVAVIDGLFTVDLEFDGGEMLFNGWSRWLEIAVRPGNSSGPYTTLSPRQELTAVPHASHAITAETLMLPMAVTQWNSEPLIKINNPGGPAISAEATNATALTAVSHSTGPALFAVNTDGGPAVFAAQTGDGPAAVFNGGNVGIGTETPQETLTVDGVIYAQSGGVKFPDNTVQTTAAASNPWKPGGSGIHYDDGPVGIGTDQPGAALHLNKPLDETAIRMQSTRFVSGAVQTTTQAPQQASASGAGPQWGNIGSVLASDNAYAQVTVWETAAPGYDATTTSRNIDLTGLGFSIPAGMAIKEIEVTADGYKTVSCNCADPSVVLHGELLGIQNAMQRYAHVPDSEGAILLWGNWGPVTRDAVNSPSFGVRLTAGVGAFNCGAWGCSGCPECNATATVYIDSVVVTVKYYDPQASTTEAEWSLGIPENSKMFVLAPGSALVFPSDAIFVDGGIVIEPERGNVGIGRVPNPNLYKLDVDGDIRCDGVAETSSRRFKQNVRPLANALHTVTRLQGVSFDWDEKHGGEPDIGFIAEEVGAVVPAIVEYEADGVNAAAMKYDRIGALNVEAIKELHAIILKQQAQIDELRTRLEPASANN